MSTSNNNDDQSENIRVTIPPSPNLTYTTESPPNSFVTATSNDEDNVFETKAFQEPARTITPKWLPEQNKEIEMPQLSTLSPEMSIFGPPFSSR